jgi:hypothetical protein
MEAGIVYANDTFTNLTGRNFGTVQILQIARRTPTVAWHFKCRCGTSGIALHTALLNGSFKCPNMSCGKEPGKPASSSGGVGQRVMAIRSSDTANARRYAEDVRRQARVQSEFTEKDFRNADPDILRHYMDRMDAEKEKLRRG